MARIGVLRTLEGGRLGFHCPGCGTMHVVRVVPDGALPCWGFNGNHDRPTFTPSVLVTGTYWEPEVTPENIAEWRRAKWEQHKVERVCHSFVTDGQIQFLGDCTHGLAGQAVPLTAKES